MGQSGMPLLCPNGRRGFAMRKRMRSFGIAPTQTIPFCSKLGRYFDSIKLQRGASLIGYHKSCSVHQIRHGCQIEPGYWSLDICGKWGNPLSRAVKTAACSNIFTNPTRLRLASQFLPGKTNSCEYCFWDGFWVNFLAP